MTSDSGIVEVLSYLASFSKTFFRQTSPIALRGAVQINRNTIFVRVDDSLNLDFLERFGKIGIAERAVLEF